MNAKSHTTVRGRDAEAERLRQVLDQHVRRLSRGRILPIPDEVAPRGWYRRFRQLISPGRKR